MSSAPDSQATVSWPASGFLAVPPTTPEVRHLYDDDLDRMGFVMNLSHLWAHRPAAHDDLFELVRQTVEGGRLTMRQRGILISAGASALGDSYCSLAWGRRLADAADPEIAGGVLGDDDSGLDASERALAGWARLIARNPTDTGPDDVQVLRAAGFDDGQIFEITLFVALRLAFSTVNAALGVLPDRDLEAAAPAPVRGAVSYGRPVSST
jgi:alkylhydroperoxidase family enzyme